MIVSRPGRTLQILTVPSRLAVASSEPSGLNAGPMTHSVWPTREINFFPVDASHTAASVAPLTEARVLPSGLNLT